jgi:hypothetical protein
MRHRTRENILKKTCVRHILVAETDKKKYIIAFCGLHIVDDTQQSLIGTVHTGTRSTASLRTVWTASTIS